MSDEERNYRGLAAAAADALILLSAVVGSDEAFQALRDELELELSHGGGRCRVRCCRISSYVLV